MKYPMTRLSSEVDMILFFIREDFKSRKFFNTLCSLAGFDDVWWQGHFRKPIAQFLKIDLDSDAEFDKFNNYMEKKSEEFDPTDDETSEQIVLDAYVFLMNMKRRQNKEKKQVKVRVVREEVDEDDDNDESDTDDDVDQQ